VPLFKYRPKTSELRARLQQINKKLPGPYDPQALSGLMVEGKNKLELEVNVIEKAKDLYFVEEKNIK
jgi:hypothetical protein